MEPGTGKTLLLLVLFWTGYFLVIYVGLTWTYFKLTGAPPKDARARAPWEARAQRIKRVLIAIAVALVVLPLALPIALKWLG